MTDTPPAAHLIHAENLLRHARAWVLSPHVAADDGAFVELLDEALAEIDAARQTLRPARRVESARLTAALEEMGYAG